MVARRKAHQEANARQGSRQIHGRGGFYLAYRRRRESQRARTKIERRIRRGGGGRERTSKSPLGQKPKAKVQRCMQQEGREGTEEKGRGGKWSEDPTENMIDRWPTNGIVQIKKKENQKRE